MHTLILPLFADNTHLKYVDLESKVTQVGYYM